MEKTNLIKVECQEKKLSFYVNVSNYDGKENTYTKEARINDETLEMFKSFEGKKISMDFFCCTNISNFSDLLEILEQKKIDASFFFKSDSSASGEISLVNKLLTSNYKTTSLSLIFVAFYDIQNNLADYIVKNEKLLVLRVNDGNYPGEKINLGKNFCQSVLSSKSLVILDISFNVLECIDENFEYILSSGIKNLHMDGCSIPHDRIYENFYKHLRNSRIEHISLYEGFFGRDKDKRKQVSKLFNFLQHNTHLASIKTDIFLHKNNVPGDFLNFIKNNKSIRSIELNPNIFFIKNFIDLRESINSNNNLTAFEWHVGFLDSALFSLYSKEKIEIFSSMFDQINMKIARNRELIFSGLLSLKYKILCTIQDKKITVPKKFPVLLLGFNFPTMIEKFQKFKNHVKMPQKEEKTSSKRKLRLEFSKETKTKKQKTKK